jgi:hypothetical protein
MRFVVNESQKAGSVSFGCIGKGLESFVNTRFHPKIEGEEKKILFLFPPRPGSR